MHSRLRMYVESLFDGVSRTREVVELREEILQNVIDRYEDLLREGKSEEDAYHTAISGIGDINALLRSMGVDIIESDTVGRNLKKEISQEMFQKDGGCPGQKKKGDGTGKEVFKSLRSAIWSVTTALYIIISFMTFAWHITWVIFLIAGAVVNMLKAYYEMKD